MSITLVGSTYDGGRLDSYETVSVNFTGGNWTGGTVQENDVVVLIATCLGSIYDESLPFTINTAGYTVDTNNPIRANDNLKTYHMVAHKVMGSTPDTSVSVTQFSNSSTYEGGIMVVVLRGVYLSNILAATPTVATGINGNVVNNAAITPVGTSAWIIITATSVSDSTNATYTKPNGYTEIRQASFANGGSSSRNPLACAYKLWVSGEEDPAAWTTDSSESSMSWAGVTLAFGTTLEYSETQTDTLNISEVQNNSIGINKTQTDTIELSEEDTNVIGKIQNSAKNNAVVENQSKNNGVVTNQAKNNAIITNQAKS